MRPDQYKSITKYYSNSKALISVYGEGINESCQSLFFSLIAIISCRQTLDEKLLEKWRTPEVCIGRLGGKFLIQRVVQLISPNGPWI